MTTLGATMELAFAKQGLGKYVSAFGAGLDPTGVLTLNLSRRTPSEHTTGMQAAGTTAALISGGTLIPSLITGTARVLPQLKDLKSVKSVGREFGGGALDLYRNIWHAGRGRAVIDKALKEKRSLSSAERKELQHAIGKNVPVGEAFHEFAGAGKRRQLSPGTLRKIQRAVGEGKLSPSALRRVSKQLGRGASMGLLGIGAAAAISGYGAYKQYEAGQELRKLVGNKA
jgi:hypothetical protein